MEFLMEPLIDGINHLQLFNCNWPGGWLKGVIYQIMFMMPNPLTTFEIKRYQNEPRFNRLYSKNKLPKIKDGSYVINLVECKSIGIIG